MGKKRLKVKEIDEVIDVLDRVVTTNPYIREQIMYAKAYLGNIANEMDYHDMKWLILKDETEE